MFWVRNGWSADPDLAIYVNADPDPVRFRIQRFLPFWKENYLIVRLFKVQLSYFHTYLPLDYCKFIKMEKRFTNAGKN